MTTAPAPPSPHIKRRTPRWAFGVPSVWVMAAAMAVCVAMIVGLFGVILISGAAAFWPRPVELVTLRDGSSLLGVPVRSEFFDPGPAARAQIAKQVNSGEVAADAVDERGRVLRRLYQIGNREINGDTFRWAPVREIERVERPEWAVHAERTSWGVFIGRPIRVERVGPDGSRTILAEGEALPVRLPELLAEAEARRERIESIEKHELARVNHALSAARVERLDVERRSREGFERAERLPLVPWLGLLGLTAACGVGSWRVGRGAWGDLRRRAAARGLAVLTLFGVIAAAALQPIAGRALNPAEAAERVGAIAQRQEELEARYVDLIAQVDRLRAEDSAVRVVMEDVPSGRFAPLSPSEPDEPMVLSGVTRLITPNTLGPAEKVGVYFGRWRDFLLDDPRDANLAGGVFPVIFGTTLLTMLLAVTVVPLGVVAAVYLREYARQGLVVSLIRIAVNNLAGVPSIVYGVFGLGFFCYTVGGFIDTGAEAPVAPMRWWVIFAGALALALGAVTLAAVVARRGEPGRWTRRIFGLLWAGAALGVVLLVFRTPYFDGLFTTRAGEGPVFGTRGMLWASLTLALLTLPVVIVATEEAIAAVPRSMREGSFGAGASQWQTIRRIVLPGAMPGIMTGAILAMARGAGEVAPLMLVGAVKLAPELPVSGEFPFVHPERSFMHLGFHIYDLWFQSPDSEAARGLVWATTLLLILIVLTLNMVAFVARARFRRRLVLRAL